MALQHQLDQVLADRAIVEQRSRAPWWGHVVTGAAVGTTSLMALLGSASLAGFGSAMLAFASGAVTTWRGARGGLRRSTRLGVRGVGPFLAWGAVAATVLVGGGVVLFMTPEGRDPLFRVGLSVAVAVVAGLGSRVAERWSECRDVVRGDLAPQHVPELDDPLRLRLAAVLATADARLDTLGELLGLDVTELDPHLAALEEARLVTHTTRRSLVTGDATWAELTYVGRGALGRHLAELRSRAAPTFHT